MCSKLEILTCCQRNQVAVNVKKRQKRYLVVATNIKKISRE